MSRGRRALCDLLDEGGMLEAHYKTIGRIIQAIRRYAGTMRNAKTPRLVSIGVDERGVVHTVQSWIDSARE